MTINTPVAKKEKPKTCSEILASRPRVTAADANPAILLLPAGNINYFDSRD